MPATFKGFSPKAITFLRQLASNNTRAWFQPRKDQFDELLRQPMIELSAIIVDQLRSFAVDHVIDPAKAVHRIYRDVRFSKDKSPYKTNLSAMYPRKGLSKNVGGGYYFSLSAKSIEIAGGIYMPGPPELAALRAAVISNPSQFKKITSDPTRTKVTGPLQGDQLARPPKGFEADHPAIDLLRRKQFYYYSILPASLATEPGLDKLIIKQFKAMSPAIDFLNGILLKAARGNEEKEDLPKRPKPMF